MTTCSQARPLCMRRVASHHLRVAGTRGTARTTRHGSCGSALVGVEVAAAPRLLEVPPRHRASCSYIPPPRSKRIPTCTDMIIRKSAHCGAHCGDGAGGSGAVDRCKQIDVCGEAPGEGWRRTF